MAEMPPVRVELIADIKEFMAKMKEAEHSIHNVGEAGKTTGAKLGYFGNKMANYALAGIGGAMVLATKYAYDYSKSLEELQLQSNISEEELKRLKGKILEVSTATATSNELIAKAYLQVSKAGIEGAHADEMVTQAAKLAKVAHADLNQTISAGIVIQGLHLSSIKNTTDLYDQLYGAVKNSRLSLDEISGIFQGKAALALSNYGIKLGETVAVASVFKKANMDANSGIAGLNLALTKLTTRNDKANNTLKEVGLSQKQIADDLKKPNGLIRVFEDLYTHIGKSGMPMQQFLNSLVGARGAQGFGYLLRNLPEIQKALGAGAADINHAFDEWLHNPEGSFAQFSNALKNTLTEAGDVFLPYATKFVKIIGSGLGKLSSDPGVQQLAIAIGATIVAGLTGAKAAKIGTAIAAAFGSKVELLAGEWGVAFASAALAYFGIKYGVTDPLKKSLPNVAKTNFGTNPTWSGPVKPVPQGQTSMEIAPGVYIAIPRNASVGAAVGRQTPLVIPKSTKTTNTVKVKVH